VHQDGDQYIVNSWCTVRKTLSCWYSLRCALRVSNLLVHHQMLS